MTQRQDRAPSLFRRVPTLGYRLPRPIRTRLFGDREQHGLRIRSDDADWRNWEATYTRFYDQTQTRSLGSFVNDAGYRILKAVDFQGKQVLEMGPGEIRHIRYWNGVPECFHIADIMQAMLDRSGARLAEHAVPHRSWLLSRSPAEKLPFADDQFDVIVSFYAFEHMYPFPQYLKEMCRVLKPGGVIAGAIPAEGGIAWGCGRYMTGRRWLLHNTNIDPDKIICWEHPNWAEDVLRELTGALRLLRLEYWPLRVPSVDLNLIISFVAEKAA